MAIDENFKAIPNQKAVSEIFNVMVWNKIIPPCYLSWIAANLKIGNWHITAQPFKSIDCKYKIVNNGILDILHFDCGFRIPDRGYSMGGFKNKHIAQGDHENLHQVSHALHDVDVAFENMEIEERFGGYRVDILGKIEERYIIVELGKLSNLGKISLIYNNNVKELWFGDREHFMYRLSHKTTTPNKERDDFINGIKFFKDYYKSHCNSNKLFYECKTSYSAFDCFEITRLMEPCCS
jgi:hypothetical protein